MGLASTSNTLMFKHLLPSNPDIQFKVSQPKPNKLYGYSGRTGPAFTPQHILAQALLNRQISPNSGATSSGLRFPFLAIEIKAAGGTGCDLWVATNQCAGAASACLNALNPLNAFLRAHGRDQIDTVCYSIAIDNNIAQLNVS